MRKNFKAKPFLYPMPVLILGTYDAQGIANAMNAAWGGIIGYNEILISLSNHKTTENILLNEAFTVSVADVAHMMEADYVGLVSGKDVPNKLERANLHTIKSEFVNAPVISEFPIALECRLKKVTDEGIVGEILNVSIDEGVLNEENQVDSLKLNAIAYDPMSRAYLRLAEKVGDAFSVGKALIK